MTPAVVTTNPTEPWTVRTSTPDDAEGIESVRIATWKACYRGIVPDAYLDSLTVKPSRVAGLQSGIERAGVGGSLVAVAGCRIIGMGFAGPPEDDRLPGGTGEVLAVYVLSDWQGRGVGRALLERLTSGLRALGYRSAILWTLRDRLPTRRFYEANGWELDGAKDSLDLQGPVHLVRYARDLSEQP